MQKQSLPTELMRAELSRLARVHNRSMDECDMRVTWRGDELCLAVSFPDGMAWEVPFDPEAQLIVEAANAQKH